MPLGVKEVNSAHKEGAAGAMVSARYVVSLFLITMSICQHLLLDGHSMHPSHLFCY
jgi:hypothetical protein